MIICSLIALLFICSIVWFVKCINGAATVDENDNIIPKEVLKNMRYPNMEAVMLRMQQKADAQAMAEMQAQGGLPPEAAPL